MRTTVEDEGYGNNVEGHTDGEQTTSQPTYEG